MMDSHTAEQRREFSTENGTFEPSNPTNDLNETDPATNTQRLPGTLEQIRALADNTSFAEQSSSNNTITLMAEPSQIPKRSGGKPKKYSCKQCGEITTTKEDQWKHARTHIPTEKQLVCTECDFVTEYKHHLQYHMRNHYGSKPFKCTKCEYTCVNKSMLNSHMKSHTPGNSNKLYSSNLLFSLPIPLSGLYLPNKILV
jgi:hunchback-like protein